MHRFCVLRAFTWGALSFPSVTDGGEGESRELLDEQSNDLGIKMEIIPPPQQKEGRNSDEFWVNAVGAPKPLPISIPSIVVSKNGFRW